MFDILQTSIMQVRRLRNRLSFCVSRAEYELLKYLYRLHNVME